MVATQSYIKGIDGLRAVAVLAVMLFHLNPALLPGGFTGVDVFFVISGYVVCASLVRSHKDHLGHYLLDFYARRIVRIYPALVTCLVLVSLVGTLFIPDSWLSNTADKTGLFAFFGLSNFALVWYDDGYFSPRAEFNIFTHTWSLGVEEQFYVVFPFVVFAWVKLTSKQGLELLGWSLLPLMLLGSLGFAVYESGSNPVKAYYLLPSRFWELAAGGLLFQMHQCGQWRASTLAAQKVSLLVGVGLVTTGFVIAHKQAFPFPYALLPVVGTCLLITGVNGDGAIWIKRLLEARGVRQIGRTSYSLYLWHWPVYVFFKWTWGLESVVEYLLAVALTFFLANISYLLIERRVQVWVHIKRFPSLITVGSGVTITVLLCAISLAIFLSQPILSLSVTKNREIWYPHAWSTSAGPIDSKYYGERRLFAIGDSHTGAYTTLYKILTERLGIEVHQHFTAACGIATLLRPAALLHEACQKRTERIFRAFEERAKPGDILLLASLRVNRLGDQWETFPFEEVVKEQHSPEAILARAAALDETRELLQRFQKSGVHIIIDAPKPIFPSPPFRCSDWFNQSNPVCEAGMTLSRTAMLNHRQPVMESMAILQKEFPGLVIWDPFDTLCPSEVCTAFADGKPLFFDGDHLSAHGNRVLAPEFLALLETLWGSPASQMMSISEVR